MLLLPHRPAQGRIQENLRKLHTTSAWKNLLPGFAFDHSKTKFPLVGKHAQVACASCHINGNFQKPLPFANCNGCHKPDPHKDQFAARAQKGECSECLTVEGWKPSLFGVKEHDTSSYPLKGKHSTVVCASCHIPAGKGTIYKVKFASCADAIKTRTIINSPPLLTTTAAKRVTQ